MKILTKIVLGLVLLLVLLAGGGLIYLFTGYPQVDAAPDIKVEASLEKIERGAYLANNVMGCIDCHSTRDWNYFSGPIKEGTEGLGGELFDENMGLPGKFYSRNITPHNLEEWTDGEVYRLITAGVTRKGTPIFPVMPYYSYGRLDPEDIKSVIAYIRTLKPLNSNPPRSEPAFPTNLLVRTMPKNASPGIIPSPSDPVKYGEYMLLAAACSDCHTPMVKGKPDFSRFLAGGQEFVLPGSGTVRPANLTPDKNTGLGNLTEDDFVLKFKQYSRPEARHIKVEKGEFNTLMPWIPYSGMTEHDLRAIYKYLRTIPPITNRVVKFTPEKQ